MLSVVDYFESIKHPKTGGNKDRLQLSPHNKLFQICINSLEPPHLNFIGQVIWTKMYLGCLSSVFWSWQGSDSSSRVDLHTGQMLHLAATAKVFFITLKEQLFKTKSNSSLTLTAVQPGTSSRCDSRVAMMIQEEKGPSDSAYSDIPCEQTQISRVSVNNEVNIMPPSQQGATNKSKRGSLLSSLRSRRRGFRETIIKAYSLHGSFLAVLQ